MLVWQSQLVSVAVSYVVSCRGGGGCKNADEVLLVHSHPAQCPRLRMHSPSLLCVLFTKIAKDVQQVQMSTGHAIQDLECAAPWAA